MKMMVEAGREEKQEMKADESVMRTSVKMAVKLRTRKEASDEVKRDGK